MALVYEYECEYNNEEKIPKYLPIKVELSNISNKNRQINFDYIVIPDIISNNIKYFHNINFTKFAPKFTIKEENFFNRMIQIVVFDKNITIDRLHIYNIIMKQIFDENISNLNIYFDDYSQKHNENILLFSDEHNNWLLVSSNIVIIIIDNILYMYNCNDNLLVMYSTKYNYVKIKNTELMLKEFVTNDEIQINSIMKSNNKSQFTTIKIDKNNDIIKQYYFENNEAGTRFLYDSINKNNGNIKEYYIKNKLKVSRIYNFKKNKSILISECMMNDKNTSTGLRFRGTYNETKINNQITKKILIKDDEIIYNKENNDVLVDKINNIKLKDEIIIGWKIAKNVLGEKRIIKLAIPLDATSIRPIDKEFFNTLGKERCDKAIVLDIQIVIHILLL